MNISWMIIRDLSTLSTGELAAGFEGRRSDLWERVAVAFPLSGFELV